MTTFAQTERAALCDLFLEVGPDAPTLCEGWNAADLAAHLVIRERRPDSAVGVMIPPLSSWTERVRLAEKRRGHQQVVGRVAAGPPRWSPLGIPRVDAAANALEFFVHHEDVRRAQPGWQPRELPPEDTELIWQHLRRMGRLAFRAVGSGVVLARPDGERMTAKAGSPQVTITGEPGEVAMYAFGRKDHAQVTLEGDAGAREALARARLGL